MAFLLYHPRMRAHLALIFLSFSFFTEHFALGNTGEFQTCQAIKEGNCALASDMNFCIGIQSEDCGITSDYLTCQAILALNCAEAPHYNFCQAIVEDDCALLLGHARSENAPEGVTP